MNKLNKETLINLLHTNTGRESLKRTISLTSIENYEKTISDNIISAQRYYVGNPDGKFITIDDFDEQTVKAKKAYETINTLIGNSSAEFMRFSEGKKQTPGLISSIGLQKIADMLVLLFSFANNGEDIAYETVRACRQTEISETLEGEFGFVDALQSSTKATVEEVMEMGYGNKNKLAICKFHFNPGAVILDMSRFGKYYLKPEEKEVLILTGNNYKAKCLGFSDKFYGKDGKPALMYDVEVYKPDKFQKLIDCSVEELKQIVFDSKMISEIKSFYESLNTEIGGKYPEEPYGYRNWKEAFKMYVYSELDKIYKNNR